MVYLVIAAIAVGIAALTAAVIIIIYLNVNKKFLTEGKEEHYIHEAKRTRNRALAFFGVIIVAGTAGYMLYAQEKCFGVTANEAFARYLDQCDEDMEDYYTEDLGDYVLYISRDDKQSGEEWIAYGQSGIFFKRVYGEGTTYLFPCNDDGTIWAGAVEIKTKKGYFYYLSFYQNSLLNRLDVDSALINGKAYVLVGGKYIVMQEKITSISV